jgi:hypothetical protein
MKCRHVNGRKPWLVLTRASLETEHGHRLICRDRPAVDPAGAFVGLEDSAHDRRASADDRPRGPSGMTRPDESAVVIDQDASACIPRCFAARFRVAAATNGR